MSFIRAQRFVLNFRMFGKSGTDAWKRFASSAHPPPASDEPVKFTTSQAAAWRAQYTREGTGRSSSNPHLIQVVSVTASFAVFMLYFCVIREENDWDEMLMRPVYETIDGLEEASLRVSYEDALNKNRDTSKIVQRLGELEAQKRAAAH